MNALRFLILPFIFPNDKHSSCRIRNDVSEKAHPYGASFPCPSGQAGNSQGHEVANLWVRNLIVIRQHAKSEISHPAFHFPNDKHSPCRIRNDVSENDLTFEASFRKSRVRHKRTNLRLRNLTILKLYECIEISLRQLADRNDVSENDYTSQCRTKSIVLPPSSLSMYIPKKGNSHNSIFIQLAFFCVACNLWLQFTQLPF